MKHDSILIVTRNFPPLTGGMERLLHKTTHALFAHYDVTLIGPTGSRRHAPEPTKTVECPPQPIKFIATALVKGIVRALRSRYRFVIAGSGLTAPVARILAKVSGGRAIVFVHGLDLVAKHPLFQRLFVPSIRRSDLIITNSNNTRDIAVSIGCPTDRIVVLHPGTEIPSDQEVAERASIRTSITEKDAKIVLFVGRITARKGLSSFLMNSWPKVRAAEPDALLIVIGDAPTGAAFNDSAEFNKFCQLLDDEKLKPSVRFLGRTSDYELCNHYLAADVLIFPLVEIDGDIEGFGMVAIEAAAFGTPTVAFEIGGVADAVADGVNGHLIPAGDYAAFSSAIVQLASSSDEARSHCRGHAERFSWTHYQHRLCEILVERGNVQA